jgi:hypothetical protein
MILARGLPVKRANRDRDDISGTQPAWHTLVALAHKPKDGGCSLGFGKGALAPSHQPATAKNDHRVRAGSARKAQEQ